MNRTNADDGGRAAARKWVTVRVTEEEKNRLAEQAGIAGLSVSEYLRRRFFGGKLIVAYSDVVTVNELRRVGGLLKNNFETMRQAKADSDLFRKQESALHLLRTAIEKISTAYRHDREES